MVDEETKVSWKDVDVVQQIVCRKHEDRVEISKK